MALPVALELIRLYESIKYLPHQNFCHPFCVCVSHDVVLNLAAKKPAGPAFVLTGVEWSEYISQIYGKA